MNQITKMSSSESPDMAALSQDTVPLSEMDKAAVLTLIREEVCSWHILKQTPLMSLNPNWMKSNIFFRPDHSSVLCHSDHH